jgi:hypothetical protein
MEAKPLEFNAIGAGAAQWWESMNRRPIILKMFASLILLLIGGSFWFIFFK